MMYQCNQAVDDVHSPRCPDCGWILPEDDSCPCTWTDEEIAEAWAAVDTFDPMGSNYEVPAVPLPDQIVDVESSIIDQLKESNR